MSSFKMGLLLLMVTGMRLSEMLALTWREFDERSGIITVKHSMERDTQIRKATKTKETRTIPLMPTARKAMVEWRTQQQEWFESKGLRWSREHPVCHNSKGTHILSATYERWWRSNRDRLGVPEGGNHPYDAPHLCYHPHCQLWGGHLHCASVDRAHQT